MIKIVVQTDIADKIRNANGQVELVDDQGNRVGVVRRPPTQVEIEFAKSRVGSSGSKVSFDELFEQVNSL